MKKEVFTLWFDEIGIKDIPLVGGKNASLGEMYHHLHKKGIKVPYGFAVTAYSYRYFLENSGKLPEIEEILSRLNVKNPKALEDASKKIQSLIFSCKYPLELEKAITQSYEKLSHHYKQKNIDVAVRSSATAEDLPDASFAGQQESYLHVSGVHSVLEICKRCFSSLFTPRAIFYRVENGFDHFQVALSIGVQKMVRSDLASAGVMFTLDTESGFSDVVYITGSYGLGENVVQGAVNPDEFYVFKPTLKKGFKALIDKSIGEKKTKIIYGTKGNHTIKKVNTPLNDRRKFCLSDEEVLQLAKWAVTIEEHYSQKNKRWMPMDIEWAKDGKTGDLFIVQARPETVQSQREINVIENYRLKSTSKVLTTGKSVGSKMGQGVARVIKSVKDISKFKAGEVLVTEMTDPDWVPIMKIASAIVTNKGGRTSHAAIVSREFGLPCVVGTNNGTEAIKSGQKVTVSCAEGSKGSIYEGLLDFKIDKVDISKVPDPKTKIMMNVGCPDEAFKLSSLPNSGVGLARLEFIVSEYIQVHPMALVKFEEVKDAKTRRHIEELTHGYKDKKQFFVDNLARGIATIAAAFYPNDVILRFSDFKTNEYANLIGGQYFEPKEANPMIGWRGASRYYRPGYEEGFSLECQAVKKVREEMGLSNLKVMIPMCRTPEEGKKILQVMKKNGLEKKKNGLEVYVMCELPSNVLLAEEFCKIFDGFSIGSNDLTQFTLGVDRDNEYVADIYDERSEAVKKLIAHVIEVAKKHKCKVGICGDAPSTYPEFAKFLVDCGIDSISLAPDAIVSMRASIAKYEHSKKAGKRKR